MNSFFHGQCTTILSFHIRDYSLSLTPFSLCVVHHCPSVLSLVSVSVELWAFARGEHSSPIAGVLHSLPPPFQSLLHSSAEGFFVLFVNIICMCGHTHIHVVPILTIPSSPLGLQGSLNSACCCKTGGDGSSFHHRPLSAPFLALPVGHSKYATYSLLWLLAGFC